MKKICAIYTRKSTEERLDMEFNSLDAQREACEAYILSQRSVNGEFRASARGKRGLGENVGFEGGDWPFSSRAENADSQKLHKQRGFAA